MTDRERMEAGLIYDPGNEELMSEQMKAQEKLWQFNHMGPSQFEERQALMKEIFAECGDDTFLQGPVTFHYGIHTTIGRHVFINFNFTCQDDAEVTIGDDCNFGPRGGT